MRPPLPLSHNFETSAVETLPVFSTGTIMRGACGMLVVAITALLVCCNADSHQNQEVSGNDHSGDRYESSGHKPHHPDSFGGRNLVREVREASRPSGFVPYFVTRRFDYGSSNAGKRDLWPFAAPVELGGYYGDGLPKRNFDEIDRSGLDNFVRKRNFDEIDQTSMPFPYAVKRSYHVYAPNSFESL